MSRKHRTHDHHRLHRHRQHARHGNYRGQLTAAVEQTAPQPQQKNIFEAFFASLSGAMAAATPEKQKVESFKISPVNARPGVAIYDISAKEVILPDGTRLEAHSGLGPLRDNPAGVKEKMRGATPPHIYTITQREALFHGVEALRLNPVGGPREIYGRDGILAHNYMLGPNGDSNGCVSFRNYKAFLKAYNDGQIDKLEVVAGNGQKMAQNNFGPRHNPTI